MSILYNLIKIKLCFRKFQNFKIIILIKFVIDLAYFTNICRILESLGSTNSQVEICKYLLYVYHCRKLKSHSMVG